MIRTTGAALPVGRPHIAPRGSRVASLLLVVVVVVTLVGVVLAAIALLRGSRRRALAWGTTVLAGVAVYAAALGMTSVTSKARHLAHGQAKCFDDWCVTLQSVHHVPEQEALRQLTIVVASRAHRVAQRPDSPAAYLVAKDLRERLDLPGLDQRLLPGQAVALHVTVGVPPSTPDPQLLITEGGFPSRLVIGDENSPWHAWSTWSL